MNEVRPASGRISSVQPKDVLLRALCLMGALGATPAWAAAGGESSDSGIVTVLVLLGFVAGAYLVAHFVVDWVQRRLLIITGFEYVLLGVLLGPVVVPELHAFADLSALAPVIAFAAGWVGLLYGMEMDLRTLLGIPDRSVRIAVVECLVLVTLVGGGSWWILQSDLVGMPALSSSEALHAAGALGAAAAAASSSAVDVLRSRYPTLQTRLLPLLRRTARLEDMLAIIVFGVLFCVYHVGGTHTERPPATSDWILLTVGLGVSLGVLFALFLGDEGPDKRFLALVGIILFASGAAFFLNLSVLLVNLLLGMVIVNTRHGAGVFETLQGTQKPVRLILLLFAGALWVPVPLGPAVALSLGVIGLRLVGKIVACWLACMGTSLRNDLFRGLLAQGEVAIAMAISLQLVYTGPAVDLAYTAILASVVFYEGIAPRLLKGLLVDAGELREDVQPVAIDAASAAQSEV